MSDCGTGKSFFVLDVDPDHGGDTLQRDLTWQRLLGGGVGLR